MRKSIVLITAFAAFSSVAAIAAQPNMNAVHVRGTISSFYKGVLTVATSSGDKKIAVGPQIKVAAIIPASRAQIHPGVFVGIASVDGVNGQQQAAEVVVFPASMRGTGEGSYPWDLPTAPGHKSKMTNGTVSAPRKSRMTNGTISKQANGSSIVVSYSANGQSGSQPITVPANAPVVTFEPGTQSELTPGAHVFVIAMPGQGGLKAVRVLVGKNGLVPPM